MILRTWEMAIIAVIAMGSFHAALAFWSSAHRWRDRYKAECRAHDKTRSDRDRAEARLDRLDRRRLLPIRPRPRFDAGPN